METQLIEPVDEMFQDNYAIMVLQKKVNEIIKVINDSRTPQTPEDSRKK